MIVNKASGQYVCLHYLRLNESKQFSTLSVLHFSDDSTLSAGGVIMSRMDTVVILQHYLFYSYLEQSKYFVIIYIELTKRKEL